MYQIADMKNFLLNIPYPSLEELKQFGTKVLHIQSGGTDYKVKINTSTTSIKSSLTKLLTLKNPWNILENLHPASISSE